MEGERLLDVEGVIATDELARRPERPPDHVRESHMLGALATELAERPENLLQRMCDLIVEDDPRLSAGISLDERVGGTRQFRWVALSGAWGHLRGGTMPPDASPCGVVIARDQMMLFERPERVFAAAQVEPLIREILLVPFHAEGRPVGTLWVNAHDAGHQFDREDARFLQSLARFASAGFQMERRVANRTAALQESEANYRTLFNSFDEGFMEVEVVQDADGRDIDMRYVVLSPSLERLTGLRDIEGRLSSEVVPDREPEWVERFGQVARTGEAIRFEMPASGLGRWFSVYLARVGNAGSRRVVAVYSDVTERKRAEADVQESEQRQAFLLRLSDALRAEPSAEAIADRALQMLSEQMRLDRCFVGIYRLAEDIGDFPHQVHDDLLPPLPAQVRLSDFPEALRIAFDRTLVVDDVVSLSDSDRASFDGLGMRALIAATLRKGDNNPLWAIVAVSTRPRVWTRGEVSLVEEVTERTWAAVERARAEAARSESEARLREFGEASSDVLWVRNAETLEWVYLTPAFEAIYGLSREEALSGDTFGNWVDLILPEDRDRAVCEIMRVREGERVTFEYRVRRPKDGEVRLLRNTDFPIRDAIGRVTHIGGVGHDATEEQATAERLKVLVLELQHRTRNLMAVVRGVTDKTLASSTSLRDFQGRIRDRLGALTRVNGLLSRLHEGDRICFDELIRSELKGHGVIDGSNHGPQVDLRGPKGIRLRSSTIQTLALGLHELATNALKYGALSQPSGRLDVSWDLVTESNGQRRLRVEWRESGVAVAVPDGAPAEEVLDGAPPRRRGYGRELIERALPYQLKAKTTYELTPEGVRCTITMPLSSTLDEGSPSAEELDA